MTNQQFLDLVKNYSGCKNSANFIDCLLRHEKELTKDQCLMLLIALDQTVISAPQNCEERYRIYDMQIERTIKIATAYAKGDE